MKTIECIRKEGCMCEGCVSGRAFMVKVNALLDKHDHNYIESHTRKLMERPGKKYPTCPAEVKYNDMLNLWCAAWLHSNEIEKLKNLPK